jgi:hypothetical protein
MRWFVRSSGAAPVERHRRFRDAISAAVQAARRGGVAIVGDGDPSDTADVIEGHEHWRGKYAGQEWSPLHAGDVYALLEEITQPDRLVLEPIRRGWFGRVVDGDISQLLHFPPYKGYSYGLAWGVSLAFMPHAFERRVRFHRTLSSARLDLFEQAIEEFPRRGANARDGAIPAGYGVDVFRRDATDAWEFVRPRVEEWLASTRTLEGLLERAREQAAEPPAGSDRWPEPALVEAFTLARLGRYDEARQRLEDWLEGPVELAPTSVENLRAALKRIASQPSRVSDDRR